MTLQVLLLSFTFLHTISALVYNETGRGRGCALRDVLSLSLCSRNLATFETCDGNYAYSALMFSITCVKKGNGVDKAQQQIIFVTTLTLKLLHFIQRFRRFSEP